MTSDLIYPITIDDIAEIIEEDADEMGWEIVEMDEDDSDDDDEGLYWQIGEDMLAYITIYDNDPDSDIQTIFISLALEDDEATLDDINYFNSNNDLVSAFIDEEDGTIILRSCLCSANGITADSLRAFLMLTYLGFADLIDDDDDEDYDEEEEYSDYEDE